MLEFQPSKVNTVGMYLIHLQQFNKIFDKKQTDITCKETELNLYISWQVASAFTLCAVTI